MVPKLPRSETYVWVSMLSDLNQALHTPYLALYFLVWNLMQPQTVWLQCVEMRKWGALNSLPFAWICVLCCLFVAVHATDWTDAARTPNIPFQRLMIMRSFNQQIYYSSNTYTALVHQLSVHWPAWLVRAPELWRSWPLPRWPLGEGHTTGGQSGREKHYPPNYI